MLGCRCLSRQEHVYVALAEDLYSVPCTHTVHNHPQLWFQGNLALLSSTGMRHIGGAPTYMQRKHFYMLSQFLEVQWLPGNGGGEREWIGKSQPFMCTVATEMSWDVFQTHRMFNSRSKTHRGIWLCRLSSAVTDVPHWGRCCKWQVNTCR